MHCIFALFLLFLSLSGFSPFLFFLLLFPLLCFSSFNSFFLFAWEEMRGKMLSFILVAVHSYSHIRASQTNALVHSLGLNLKINCCFDLFDLKSLANLFCLESQIRFEGQPRRFQFGDTMASKYYCDNGDWFHFSL